MRGSAAARPLPQIERAGEYPILPAEDAEGGTHRRNGEKIAPNGYRLRPLPVGWPPATLCRQADGRTRPLQEDLIPEVISRTNRLVD